ncbi:MAG TPA: serine/threonine-protein kinase [Rhodanobacteraceae bacterium]|nr:serine/threonine-protein kinase [Rhodanobacteraceae bacterium]
MTTPKTETGLARDATEVSARAVPRSRAGATETELGEGDRLGAWRLVRKLAQGGMGAVYLAERADGHFEQQAAIKLIRGRPNDEMLLHFARERQILATLQHPNIARLLDGGATPGGQPYLVMEYVEGEPIDAYCADHALPLDARLRLFEQVCSAVQFAHQRLIVHCDLKPSNVLVQSDGTPVLLDFGIARALDRPRKQDAVEAAYFTPGYASPEQLRNEAVTTASDVYSLGLILFELVAGRKARIDTVDRTIALLGDAAVQPSEIAAKVPWKKRIAGDIDAIVLRATAAEPSARYAAADEIAADLRRHRAMLPVSARAPTLAYRSGRLLRRRWPLFAAGIVALAMIAAFTWRIAAERDRAFAAEHEARVQATAAERVSDFLVSVFNVSNPRLNGRRDVSAREVLDEGAKRIQSELADQPKVKAKLLDTLATAYRFIGEPAQSVDLFREAADLYLDPEVREPLAAAKTLSQLAVGYANASYPRAEAEKAARRSLALREANGGDALDIADAYNSLGIVLESEDKFDEAEAALKKALALRRANGDDDDSIAASLHNLGIVAMKRGESDASLAYYREALDLRRKAVGEHSPTYQITLTNYGMALGAAHRSAEAVPVLEQSLAIARELFGDDSDNTAAAHNELGSVLHDLGRFRDALAHYREALRIEKATIGDAGAEVAKPLNNMASAYEDMGDFAAAMPLFRESLAIRSKTLGADDPMVLRAVYNLGRASTKSGALKEARPLLERALGGYRKLYGEANPNTAKAELWLGEWNVRAGDLDAATARLAAIESSKAKLSPLVQSQRATLAADIAAARHDTAAEIVARKQAWDLMRDAWGESHPLTAECAVAYAVALARAHRSEEAAAVARPVVSIVDGAFAEDSKVRRELSPWR